MASTSSPAADVLIIGGGPAGLAATLSLSRTRLTGVVFNSGLYRAPLSATCSACVPGDTKGRYNTVQPAYVATQSVNRDEAGGFKVADATGKERTG